jgi:hypothetical protein
MLLLKMILTVKKVITITIIITWITNVVITVDKTVLTNN